MANKRSNGEGSFYFDEKKQLYRAMLVTPGGKRISKSSKDEEIVKDWLNEQRLLIGRNQHVEPSTLILHDLLVSWVETYAKCKVRQRTYERYESLINHVEPLGTCLYKNLLLTTYKAYTTIYKKKDSLGRRGKKFIT